MSIKSAEEKRGVEFNFLYNERFPQISEGSDKKMALKSFFDYEYLREIRSQNRNGSKGIV